MTTMTKKRVTELEGAHLDWAVAKAAGLPLCCDAMQPSFVLVGTGAGDLERFSPSTDWSHGGPIIERERVRVRPMRQGPLWFAEVDRPNSFSPSMEGPTPLIAAMRAFVASKLGDEVEVPV